MPTSSHTAAAVLGLAALCVASAAHAQAPDRDALNALPDTPGSGAFPAIKEMGVLEDQVLYRPADLDAAGEASLGVYAFGNGGCSDDAASSRMHLLEIASHGYLAIAPGQVYSGPGALDRPQSDAPRDPASSQPTRPGQLTEAIDWALAENAREGGPYFGKIDPDAIAVSGFSCGGLQALTVAHDPRVATVVVMNSGVLNEGPGQMGGMEAADKALLDGLHTPTLYVLGGETDIAYANGMDDFARIGHVPVAVANIDKGHGGTYMEPNGGAAAAVVVDWLDWRLRGDAEAGTTFLGADCGLCTDPDWTFEAKGLD